MLCNRDKKCKPCYFDEKRKAVVHFFAVHSCRCTCGEKIIRTPVKKDDLFLFGGGVSR